MLRKFKDRVKLGVSPSATVEDWDYVPPKMAIKKKEDGITNLPYDGDKVEPTFNPVDLEGDDNA